MSCKKAVRESTRVLLGVCVEDLADDSPLILELVEACGLGTARFPSLRKKEDLTVTGCDILLTPISERLRQQKSEVAE